MHYYRQWQCHVVSPRPGGILLLRVTCAKHGYRYDHSLSVCPSLVGFQQKQTMIEWFSPNGTSKNLVFGDVKTLLKFEGYQPQQDNFLRAIKPIPPFLNSKTAYTRCCWQNRHHYSITIAANY